MLSYILLKKDLLRQYIGRCFYKYGLFCSVHPLLMISFSVFLIIICCLPLTSFPMFEKIVAFLFQRIQLNYYTRISDVKSFDEIDDKTFGYVQQMNFNLKIKVNENISEKDLHMSLMESPILSNLERRLRYPATLWNETCVKLHRDPPSMKALRKRIHFPRGSMHEDFKRGEFYKLNCLFLFPKIIYGNKNRQLPLEEFSSTFRELIKGKVLVSEDDEVEDDKQRIKDQTRDVNFMITLFFKSYNKTKHDHFLKSLGIANQKDIVLTTMAKPTIHKVEYKFSDENVLAELLPLIAAYVFVFFYIWFSVAKLQLLHTRWGLAFAACMNFLFSFTMAIGICATFDVLPTVLNVSDIFPYVVILIGIENFWIITKAVMTTKKDLDVEDRIARGLGTEGWYITKNLVVEILLLLLGYLSGVKRIQEFSVFALACYLSDFFLQMAFFTPILAVDTRRAEVGLPITNPSAWKYAFKIDIEKPEGTKQLFEKPRSRFSAAINLAFKVARYRVLQRTVMVMILFYFALTVTLPIHDLVNNANNNTKTLFHDSASDHNSCIKEPTSAASLKAFPSWRFLCGKHWPELLNYYFVHLNDKSLIVLPQVKVDLDIKDLKVMHYKHPFDESLLWDKILSFIKQTSNPVIIITALIFFAGMGKVGAIINEFIQRLRNKNDIYAFKLQDLTVPCRKRFRYKLMKMTVDDTDTLVCSYNNGAIYVWDLYNCNCTYYVDRRSREVKNISIHRSNSTHSLPNTEQLFLNEKQALSRECLPPAVWCLAFKSDVLIVGCDKGSVEIYSLENECLQSYYQHEVESGVVSVKIISCIRFVVAYKYGQVEFCRLRSKQPGHQRTNSLPQPSPESYVVEVCRRLKVSNHPIIAMEIAIDKLFIASLQGQVKILRASDDGGIPMHSNISRDQEVTVIKTEQIPEIAIIGTSTGNIYILNSIGQTTKTLCCGDEEVMSITSDDDYIAVLAYDGVLTVWLKDGYIKWWQVNLLSYGGAYEIVSLARYSLAAISIETVIILNIVSRTIVRCIEYRTTPSIGLIMATPVVCQNKGSISIPSAESTIFHLKFPKLIDRNR